MIKSTYICDRCGKEVPNITHYTKKGYVIMKRDTSGLAYAFRNFQAVAKKG